MDTATKFDPMPTPTPMNALKPRTDITGWGADLDRANRPAVPMERTPPRLPHPPDGDPSPQEQRVRILHSTERPGLTPLFGTPNPPSGLSGFIREQAFKQSENDIRHWLMLFVADRINVVEGIGQDIGRGKFPNVFAEMGIKSAWKHDRAGVINKALLAVAMVGVALAWRKRRAR